MKSNDVRMQLDRDLHAQFKRVDGESNDERMKKLLDDSKEKYKIIDALDLNKTLRESWKSLYFESRAIIKTLASALAVSIAVSACSVAYVCAVNGWLS
ncbi:TMhelix containing protein [Vibrio phage 1.036.O._10N.286.45.C3]|nr:TMhelix containing protein [Vibrio phage 1.036.O._10N.286.45.C3]